MFFQIRVLVNPDNFNFNSLVFAHDCYVWSHESIETAVKHAEKLRQKTPDRVIYIKPPNHIVYLNKCL